MPNNNVTTLWNGSEQMTGQDAANTADAIIYHTPGGGVSTVQQALDNSSSSVPVGSVMTFDGSVLPGGYEPYQTQEQRDIATLNDNLAQTPITVGGETLSTIDDKLNYLLEGKQTFDIIAFEQLRASGTQNYSINSNYKYILHVINMYAQATYNNNCTLATIENGNITYYNHGTTYQTITLSSDTLTIHEGSGNAPLAISLIKLN